MEKSEEITTSKKSAASKSTHLCQICDKSFTSKSNLNAHVMTVHKENVPYKCFRCEATFKQRGSLNYHISSFHEDKRPHKCDVHCITQYYA